MYRIILCFSHKKHTFHNAELYVSYTENIQFCTEKYKL